jgi:hypothetical protein
LGIAACGQFLNRFLAETINAASRFRRQTVACDVEALRNHRHAQRRLRLQCEHQRLSALPRDTDDRGGGLEGRFRRDDGVDRGRDVGESEGPSASLFAFATTLPTLF